MADEPNLPLTLKSSDLITANASTVGAAADVLIEAWRLGCTGRSDEALTIALGAWNVATADNNARRQAQCSVDIAWYCFQLGLAEFGHTHARSAAEFWAASQEPAAEAKARAMVAWLLLELGCIEDASIEAMEALDLAESGGDATVLCLALNVVGVMFWSSKQIAQGIDFCGRAVALARELGDLVILAWWLINLGCAHSAAAKLARERDDPHTLTAEIKLALEFTDEALALAAGSDPWAQRICLANSAEYLIALEDFAGAEQRLIAYDRASGSDCHRGRTHYLYTLGQTLIALGRLDEAIECLHECVKLAENNNNIDALLHASRYLCDAYEKMRRFDLALSFHKRFHKIHLQLSAEKAQQRTRMAEILYETNKLKALVNTESQRARDIAQSYQELKQTTDLMTEAAYLDPLTGLYNRRRLDLILPDLEHETRPYTIAMIDIDHFKTINDDYSHMIGDQVLRQVGALILLVRHGDDMAVRFGGEEFLLLIRQLGLPGAAKVCHRLRQTIAAWNWDSIAADLKVTVSIGAADNIDAATPRAILELADHRLYRAKRSGRNRVISADSRSHVGLTGKSRSGKLPRPI